jgi:hypothetical protein
MLRKLRTQVKYIFVSYVKLAGGESPPANEGFSPRLVGADFDSVGSWTQHERNELLTWKTSGSRQNVN